MGTVDWKCESCGTTLPPLIGVRKFFYCMEHVNDAVNKAQGY